MAEHGWHDFVEHGCDYLVVRDWDDLVSLVLGWSYSLGRDFEFEYLLKRAPFFSDSDADAKHWWHYYYSSFSRRFRRAIPLFSRQCSLARRIWGDVAIDSHFLPWKARKYQYWHWY